ncbi:MAG: hypothetical protein ACW98K_03795 [Candidatus Kariarchaeaceae archaeon]|jgi:hypothetical protein
MQDMIEDPPDNTTNQVIHKPYKSEIEVDYDRYTLYYLFGLIMHTLVIALLVTYESLRDNASSFFFGFFVFWVFLIASFNQYQMNLVSRLLINILVFLPTMVVLLFITGITGYSGPL